MTAKRISSLKTLSVLGLCVFGTALAHAQTWTVREYGGATAWTSEDPDPHPCGCLTVTGGTTREITITANPSRELKFEIYFADGNGRVAWLHAAVSRVAMQLPSYGVVPAAFSRSGKRTVTETSRHV